MKVKICGITNLDDALHAVACGADALGFVFYKHSPRYIAPEAARHIVEALPPFVERVGLFVNETQAHIESTCQQTGMSRAQLHFDIDETFLDGFSVATLPVVRAATQDDVTRFAPRYRLVDAFCESYGGSGKRLNLEWFEGVDCSRIVLAGGLTPDNIKELRGYGFYGVDVSSGVEATKGKKDPRKVEAFIRDAKAL